MSLFQPRFANVTLRDMRVSLGWGNQTSQITLQLVRDFAAGDIPKPPPIGWPAYVEFYGFRFAGLLQKWTEVHSTELLPGYEAVLIDPREILEGTQLVIGDFAGPTGGVPNLVNCFGFHEAQAFGGSGANRAGMQWSKIRDAVNSICNTPLQGAYGGPLNYRGVAYAIDLTQVPSPPGFYRFGGASIGLLDAITQLCEECNCDYFVELVGLTIRIRVESKNIQPPLGTISAVVNAASLSGGAVRGEFGVEGRNETTSAFIVGGAKTDLYLTTGIAQFWGYDLSGQPVIGSPGTHADVGPTEIMFLNATGVEDILGSTSYRTNTIEIRAALKSQEAWTQYIAKYKRTSVFPLIQNLYDGAAYQQKANAHDVIDDSKEALERVCDEIFTARTNRLYGWLRSYADSHYGKQFLVQLPFLLQKTDAETMEVSYDKEPTSSGFLADGAESLGISPLNQDIIQDADERILPFARYEDMLGADLNGVDKNGAALENNKLWVKANLGTKVLSLPGLIPVPCVHLELPSAVFDDLPDVYGGVDGPFNQALFGQGKLKDIDYVPAGGTLGVCGIHPAARMPGLAAVPLKSNKEVYGPWSVAGAPGKVRFESDPSLVPWEYGGYAAMNAAGNSKVATSISTVQLQESGAADMVGAPLYSLGDSLAAGGPSLTNLDVQFGVNGVTTNYRFATHTPRFGMFSRQNAERLKRSALAGVQLRRDMRRALNKAFVATSVVQSAYRGAAANLPLYAKKQSPHTVLIADAIAESGGRVLMAVGTETYQAALTLSRPHASGSEHKALMSWTGLLRPFTTQATGNLSRLPNMTLPATGLFAGANQLCPAADTINPFVSGHDIHVITSRTAYSGVNAYRRGADASATRGIGLRGPLWVVGWGPGTDGGYYPGGSGGSYYLDDVLKRPDKWKAGPVDLLWDDRRGVWTSHDILTAVLPTGIVAGGGISGAMGVATGYVGGVSGWPLAVYNRFHGAVASGTYVMVGYAVNEHRWHVLAADCVA